MAAQRRTVPRASGGPERRGQPGRVAGFRLGDHDVRHRGVGTQVGWKLSCVTAPTLVAVTSRAA